MAARIEANLLIANVNPVSVAGTVQEKVLVAGRPHRITDEALHPVHYHSEVTPHAFQPSTEYIDAHNISEQELSQLIIQHDSWMIVNALNVGNTIPQLNIHTILNKVRCPLMLIPEDCHTTDFSTVSYLADLRYCQLPVVRYLSALAKPYQAGIQIAHLPADGLPDMDQQYATEVFSDGISRYVKYDNLFFNNIKERDIHKAVDIMVHAMDTNLIALVNHQYHFRELLNGTIKHILPAHVHVPVLVFPN
ncbi:hypothetical protein GCM10023149_14240 [Mucilaginibacter gynuensis]|uniref:Universal stress protein family protein n=2 Tax=Mucilaginibacter gynuensis TaxID=1302236 RepID=A0ABP8G445_9SPHI